MTVERRLRRDGWATCGRPVAKRWWQRSCGRNRRSSWVGESDVNPFPTAMEPLPAVQLNASNAWGSHRFGYQNLRRCANQISSSRNAVTLRHTVHGARPNQARKEGQVLGSAGPGGGFGFCFTLCERNVEFKAMQPFP